MKKMDAATMRQLLTQIPTDLLKSELLRRKTVERARAYLPSAERTLARAQAKVKLYRDALAAEDSKDNS